jgi:hypothetical protein
MSKELWLLKLKKTRNPNIIRRVPKNIIDEFSDEFGLACLHMLNRITFDLYLDQMYDETKDMRDARYQISFMLEYKSLIKEFIPEKYYNMICGSGYTWLFE